MKALSVLGTIAMFMVGGGILMHGVPALHHVVDSAAAAAAGVPGVGGLLKVVTPTVIDAVAGVIAGAVALVVVTIGTKLFKRKGAPPPEPRGSSPYHRRSGTGRCGSACRASCTPLAQPYAELTRNSQLLLLTPRNVVMN